MVVHNLDDMTMEQIVKITGRYRLLNAFFQEVEVRLITREELINILKFSLTEFVNDGTLWLSNLDSYNDKVGDRLILTEFLQTISDEEFSRVIMRFDKCLREINESKETQVKKHYFIR